MNKRAYQKLVKRAEVKILNNEPRSQMETIAFKKHMEKWLGPEIIGQIKQFGRGM